jgi:2-haloacid dehalogenase
LTIRALLFDTVGTVMNWRESIIDDFGHSGAEPESTSTGKHSSTNGKQSYRPGMDAVRRGTLPWTRVDRIYRVKLVEIPLVSRPRASRRGGGTHLNRVWHRLRPWPDAVAGLERLKRRYVMLRSPTATWTASSDMAKHAALPWDVVLCAEVFRHYKPDPEVYLQAIALLNVAPSQVMMVAAHNYDLRAARTHGMATAFVPRPTEYGPGQTTDLEPEEGWMSSRMTFRSLPRSSAANRRGWSFRPGRAAAGRQKA